MDHEIREVRRVLQRAFQLGRYARNRISSSLSAIPVHAFYAASFVATLSVLLHAYVTHEQFYPAVTFLMSSKMAIMVFDVQFVVLAYLFLKFTIWAFFGPLTIIEHSELYEKAWYDSLDCLMLVTLVKGEVTHLFGLEIMMLIMNKAVTFVTSLRVDAQAVALETSRLTHTKMIVAILTSLCTSLRLAKYAYDDIMSTGSTHQLVLGVEHMLGISTLTHISFKYGVYMYSRYHPGFYRKDEYLKAAEVVNYFVQFACYLLMISYLSLYDMLPLFLLKNVYHALKDFTQSFDTWRRARSAIQAIESSLFDITNEQLAELDDRTCAICRDEMTPSTRQKRLTCGHCFHVQCVRDWFQRAPSCPTCRADVIRQSAPTHNARDQNDPRRNRNGGAGDEENGRIPPEVVEMLNRLARLANETNGIPNNDNLRLDGQDYNVHISVSQHSYLIPTGGTPAPTPPPVPRTVLNNMDVQELMNLADSMSQSLQVRNDWARTMQTSLLNDHRSLVQGIDEVQNIIAQIFARIAEVRQGSLPAAELDRLTQYTERLQQLVQDVQRISDSAAETTLRGFASSTRNVGTQCPVRSPTIRPMGRLFSDGELSRRRLLAQRNLIDMGRPIGRSVSDDAVPAEFRMRRASTEPIWDTFRPTITPPPSLYAPSTWEAPSVANPEEPLSTWSGDSPGGFSQETFTQFFNTTGESAVSLSNDDTLGRSSPRQQNEETFARQLNSTAGATPFMARDDAQERLRQRRIARYMEEE